MKSLNWLIVALTTVIVIIVGAEFVQGATIDFDVANITYNYESNLTGSHMIGLMPKVVLYAIDEAGNPISGAKICGQWYTDGVIASIPNGTLQQGIYCRTTADDGSTFFSYRDRFNNWYSVEQWNPSLIDVTSYDLGFNVTDVISSGYSYTSNLGFIEIQLQ